MPQQPSDFDQRLLGNVDHIWGESQAKGLYVDIYTKHTEAYRGFQGRGEN